MQDLWAKLQNNRFIYKSMKRKILIMGLPGSGKTTLSNAIKDIMGNVICWNADEVRSTINKHLTFSLEDRITQAETMKWLSDKIVDSGHFCIVDFICPTPETREAFDYESACVVWVDRIDTGRFDDTNQMFVPPEHYDIRVIDDGRPAERWAEDVLAPLYEW